MIEALSRFVDYHSRELIDTIKSHLDDTPHFLRKIETFKNSMPYIPDDVVPVTIDVIGLYPNIPTNEGILAFQQALDRRKTKEAPTQLLIAFLELVLTCNIGEFNKQNFLQLWGTSMGSKCSTSYADIFMDNLETKFLDSLHSKMRDKIMFYGRFLDDVFLIWRGTEEELGQFMHSLNDFHPTIKFKKEGDFKQRQTTFLDVTVGIQGGKLTTDLYTKPTAACAYLSPYSCHPLSTSRNIPYSLAFRIRRICSEESDFITKLSDLKRILLGRHYNARSVDAAFDKVKNKSRESCLLKVPREEKREKTTFVTTYDPRIANVGAVVKKHFKTMCLDSHMKEIFQGGIQVGYRRHRNLREFLVRSRLYDVNPGQQFRPKREVTGWKTCNNCTLCRTSENRGHFKSFATKVVYPIKQHLTCKTHRVIYLLECKKCGQQGVGKTTQNLMARAGQHRRAVLNGDGSQKMYQHFQSRGHTTSDMRFLAIEQVFGDDFILAARETFWIDKLQTIRKGLNSNRT